ncbi:MAG: 3'-5' exonuclease [Bacteroidales bacterium]|jgi:ribonuclease D|nr:3'-5' exonuclease [Bacteroidales bacterium]
MFAEEITNEEIKNLPLVQFTGKIFVIDSQKKVELFTELIKNQPIIGIDTETKPSFKKGAKNPVSLLQIATLNQAFLFRINLIGLPDSVIQLFENPDIKKIGLALKDDIQILKQIKQYKPAGFIDLQHYVKAFGIQSTSLKKIMAIIFGQRISKSQQVTNWDRPELTEAQQIYAATDAWACYQIYKELNNQL